MADKRLRHAPTQVGPRTGVDIVCDGQPAPMLQVALADGASAYPPYKII